MKKRHTLKRLAGLVLAAALALSLVGGTGLPAWTAAETAQAAEAATLSGGETITEGGTYRLADGATGTVTVSTTEAVVIEGSGVSWDDDYVMDCTEYEDLHFDCAEGADLTLKDAFITNNGTETASFVDFTGSGNRLSIEGTVVLENSGLLYALLHVGEGTSLTIAGTGTLYLYKYNQAAGIGGDAGELNGDITFGDDDSSLTVFAKGSKQGALIGAGADAASEEEDPGSISFVEGTYNLVSVSRGAVIGGSAGSGGASDGTTVYVGTKVNMNINVDYSGAAVGGGGYDGGNDSSGGTLYVTGGSLRCYIDTNAAGNTTGWNGQSYTEGVNDAAITAQRLNGDGEAVYWSAFNTGLLDEEAEYFEVYVDGELFYEGGLPEYGFVQELLDKGEQLSIASTVSNWYKNGETNLYFYLTGEDHTVVVNGESFTFTWDSESEGFTVDELVTAWYEVTENLENITSSGDSAAKEGKKYTATLTAADGYALPESITVTVNGEELTAGTGYSYSAATGELIIYAAYTIGPIAITAAALEDVYEVSAASGSSFTYFGTVEEAFAYANTLGTFCTVTLRADCTVTESLAAESGSEFTLDLAGYTLAAGEASSISVLTVNGSLAVTDSSEDGSGTVTGGTGTLMDGVSYGGGIYVPSGGSLTLTGGCVTGNTADYGGGIYAAGSVSLSGTPAITGNTSAGDTGGAEDNLYLPSGNTATLAGSLEDGAQVCVSAADVPLDGVTVPVTASESGTSYYLQSVSYIISDAGCYVVADTDAKCLVLSVQEGREASVETADGTVSYYGTVEEAFAYVNTADTSCTVTLVSDCGITESLTLAWGHTAVLDLCGHTLAAEEGSSISVITVNGTMTLTDSSEDGTGTVTGGTGTVDDSYNPRGGGVYVAAWGSFTMAGGSITGNTLTATSFSSRVENEGSGFGAYGGGVCAMGDFTMTGGTISGNTVSGTYANDLCGGGVYAAGSVLMAGGSITGNKLIGSTTHYGGGLFAGGGFVMLAGSICDNVVTMAATSRSVYKGAGVYCTGGTAYINGGTISGNTASGNTQGTSTTSGLSLYNAGSYYPYVLGNKQSKCYVESDIETGCYGILGSLSHLSLGSESAAAGEDFTTALAADDGYALPGTLTLSYTAGGGLLTAGEDYAYDVGEGTLTIYAAALTGPVTVSGAGIPGTCSVSSSLEGAVLSGRASTAGGEDYSAVISALEGYSLPDAIVVEVDGTALTAGEDYSYDAESGALTIYAAAVTGDIVVSNAPAASVWEEPAQDEEGYYLLYDTEDILAFADMVENGYADSSARLMADVTVGSDTGFAGIGAPYAPYTGTFDGDGHAVTVAISTDGAAGFFACVSGAVIGDLTVEGTVEATSGTYGAAGLVSYVSSGGVTIRNCMNGADISGTAFVGGLVGRSGTAVTITIEDSSNEGDITNTGFYSGGITARICNGSITGCLNYGAVSALGYAGGIAGIAYSYEDLEIQNCGNEGMVTATGSGSSVSTDEGTLYSGYYAGGITGSARRELSTSLTMDSLYNAGDVSGYVYVGGITGSYCSDVGNAYNTGTVSQTNSSSSYSKSSGGLLGQYTTYDDAVVSNAYNAGEAPNPLIGTGGSSGYTGSGSTYSENCYFLETLGTDSYGIAVSSDELAALAGTLGDAYKENGVESYHGGYPVLSWEEPGEQYGVSFSLTNASVGSYWETTIAGAGWRAVLEADEYYALPDTITVTSGGTELTAGEDYTYDPSTGCIRVYGGSVTGAITVSAEAGLASYAVSISLEHVSNGGSAKAAIGEDYTTVLAADESYSLPEGVSVIVDGIMLAAGEDYTYDAETGELAICASVITGDILVSAAVDTDMAVQDEDGYCLIGTQAELEYFAWMTGSVYAGFSARLTADIEVPADAGFTGIGTANAPYAGTFDGDGHTVTLEVSTDGAAGLFAYVSGACIQDVATAGTVETTVNTYGCAGIVSYVMADGVIIENCANYADVSGTGYVGGLVGRTESSYISVLVTGSSNEGSVTGTGSYVGGIAARVCEGSMAGCANYGTVSGTSYVGGIVGYAYSTGSLEVLECGNEGSVTGTGSYTGGITGYARLASSGELSMGSLYNAGSVSGTSYVGGITGRNCASLYDAYNTGTVTGTAVTTGGITGNNYAAGTVLSNAYNAGEVTYTSSGVAYAGGLLAGSISGTGYILYVDNAYYLSTLDGSAAASGSSYLYSYSTQAALTDDELAAMAKTSDELAALADTLGDSFVENTDSGYHLGYPVLAWEETGDDAEKLQIITQPADYTGTAGSTAVFEVEAIGSSLTYQWQYLNAGASTWRDSGMDGADTASISVPVTEARDGQQYRCIVTDADGNTVTSDAATLTVSGAAGLAITLQPSDYTGEEGNTATFTVEADGTGLTYQWQYMSPGGTMWHDSGMTGADTATLSVPITAARDGQQYRCIVTDENGDSATSDTVTLTVSDGSALRITLQPSDYTGAVGDTAAFTVEAEGDGLAYQWQYKSPGGTMWHDSGMDGADTAALSVPITAARDGQQYRCVVTDADGNTVTSGAAALYVGGTD